MNGQVTEIEAKTLVDDVQKLMNKIEKIPTKFVQIYKNNIKNFAIKIKEVAIIEALKIIPVEEVNKDKLGIRTKSLRDAGYNNLADLYLAADDDISNIKGIGESATQIIREKINEMASKVRNESKIKLSIDNKTSETTQLVINISKYKQCKEYGNECEKFIWDNRNIVFDLINEIKPITGTTKYVFDIQRQKANEAYIKLKAIFDTKVISRFDKIFLEIDRIKSITSSSAWDDFAKNAAEFNGILQELFPELIENENGIYGLTEELAKEIQDQEIDLTGLNAKLRKYQEIGVKYIVHQEKTLLGDEMGLGKTVQAIASMVSLRNNGATHFMVVCPAGVLINWCREIVTHSDLKVIKLHGPKKKKLYNKWLELGGVAVTTYESLSEFMLRRQFKFSMLVVDEAHYIKNPEAKRTQKIDELCRYAERLLFMTGTALENRVDEMLDILSMLRPDIAKDAADIAFMYVAQQFREKISPVYFRRKRDDVLNELPDKIEIKEWCEMIEKEEFLYEEAILNKKIMEARRVSWNLDDLAESSKARRLKEIIEQAEDEGRKVLVFSFFRQTVEKVRQMFNRRCIGAITGEVPADKRQAIIDKFDNAPAGTILVSQIQAGGVGLNIQTASVVVICEPQLKPSIENQAISRAYRMGQARKVSVHRLLCENSIDERIMTMLENKQNIFDTFADKSEAALALSGLSEEEIAMLILEENEKETIEKLVDEETKRIKEKRAQLVLDLDGDKNAAPSNANFVPQKNDAQAPAPIATDENNSKNENREYEPLIDMSYNELVSYLLNKYGTVQGDYYENNDFAVVNTGILRKDEGLICHHVSELNDTLVGEIKYAKRFPIEEHLSKNLIYCNIMEHFLLHAKIAEESLGTTLDRAKAAYNSSAIVNITRQINSIYNGIDTSLDFEIDVSNIQSSYDVYVKALNKLWNTVNGNEFYSIVLEKQSLATDRNGTVNKQIYASI